ncbi:hypothetical protein Tco_0629294 [Tanacetum coccineum]|uniref:Retrovirus-related Pol polyprotein from transposon TNT 1-94 n=1 Tax=Tanacetum coccineum TaxID=301880 RepID=A0ABQ4WST8_9ASTR
MFAMICTRPDIAHAVGVVSRYMAEPGLEHWEAVKMILRYIKGTSNIALCFGESDLIVKGYVDSDYVGDLDGSKSTTGYVFTLCGGTVSWASKLQSVVVMSTTEAEYFAAAQASKEAVWNPAFHSKTKHIRVQYHFVREKVEEGTVDMQKIDTDDNKRKQHGSARKDNGVKIDWASIEYSSGRLLVMKGQMTFEKVTPASWIYGSSLLQEAQIKPIKGRLECLIFSSHPKYKTHRSPLVSLSISPGSI